VKVGDLVQHIRGWPRAGIVVERVYPTPGGVANKVYEILWQNSCTIEQEVWDYDLKLLSEKKP